MQNITTFGRDVPILALFKKRAFEKRRHAIRKVLPL
jgi:hypothetical protein